MLPDRDQKTWAKGLALFSAISVELLGCTGAGMAVGYWLWKKVGLPWWVLLIFSTAGLVLAFYRLYEISKKDLND